MEQAKILETDVLVVGAGIAGMQAALDAADQGVRVVLAEKNASIGGRMINLSKVFPTLDCASAQGGPRWSYCQVRATSLRWRAWRCAQRSTRSDPGASGTASGRHRWRTCWHASCSGNGRYWATRDSD